MKFPPIRRLRITDQVASSLREAILSGELSPGDNLPTERELASRFSVNRSSVREALRRLEGLGLVEVRHGGGSRVRDFLSTAGVQLLPFLMAPGGRLDLDILRDLLELRVVIMGFTASLAARRHRPEQLEALARTLRELELATSRDERQALDFSFFHQQVEMSGNRVLCLLSNAVGEVTRHHPALFASLYPETPFPLKHHAATLAAIAEGDAGGAAGAMEAYGKEMLQWAN